MIRSTFSSFTTAHLALSASQFALSVTGQNIANINTYGYTRQRLDQVSLNLDNGNIFNNMTCRANIGYGVQVTGVSQIRDPFLDVQYRSEIVKVGTADAKQTYMDRLKNIFDETENEGIRKALSDLTGAFDDLDVNSGDQEFDSILRSRFQVFINHCHTKAEELSGVRTEMEKMMNDNTVPELNELLDQIAELNTNIYSSQVVGNPALELKDERNALIDELASYLPINVNYVPHTISTGEKLNTLDITIKGTDIKLISNGEHADFKYAKNADGKSSISLKQIADNTGAQAEIDISDKITDGTLKGSLEMLNEAGTLGDGDTRGLAYYEKAFDSFVTTFVTTFNDLNAQYDADGNQVKQEDLFQKIDPNKEWSASNVKISDKWMNNQIHIFTSSKVDAGSTASDNVIAMIKALTAERDFNVTAADGTTIPFYQGSFDQCYGNIENIQGIDSKANTTILNNHISVLQETADAKDAVSGVQIDEEAMDLMKFSKSYNAAARFMTALDEALDVLINKTGLVGR